MAKRMKQIPHNVYYEFETKEKEKYHQFIERKITKERHNIPIAFQMMNVAQKQIHHFISDFYVHDYNSITTDSCRLYIWNVYNSGSRLVKLDNEFQENAKSSWEYFSILRENHYFEKGLTFLVDLTNQKLSKITPEKITINDFNSRHGSVKDYFDRQSKNFDISNYLKTKEHFQQLLIEYKDHPPKKKVDEILKSPSIA